MCLVRLRLLQVVTRHKKGVQQDRALVSGKHIGLMALVGETNQGKTTVADSILRMTAPMSYLPFDVTLDSRKVSCSQSAWLQVWAVTLSWQALFQEMLVPQL
jgi:ABC-type dipeptide/oligopeptide/nickel transport system ATPase component